MQTEVVVGDFPRAPDGLQLAAIALRKWSQATVRSEREQLLREARVHLPGCVSSEELNLLVCSRTVLLVLGVFDCGGVLSR